MSSIKILFWWYTGKCKGRFTLNIGFYLYSTQISKSLVLQLTATKKHVKCLHLIFYICQMIEFNFMVHFITFRSETFHISYLSLFQNVTWMVCYNIFPTKNILQIIWNEVSISYHSVFNHTIPESFSYRSFD